MKWWRRQHQSQKGVTILELLVVISVIGIISVVTVEFVFSYFIDNASENVRTELQGKVDESFRAIEEHLPAAAAMGNANTITDPNKLAGWTAALVSPVVIIAEIYAVDANNAFIRPLPDSPPYIHNIIYYVDSGRLYRRVLANPLAVGSALETTCSVNATTPTCLPAYDKPDSQLTEDVTTFSAQYVDNLNNSVADPANAHALSITLRLERTIIGRSVSTEKTVQFTLRNQ